VDEAALLKDIGIHGRFKAPISNSQGNSNPANPFHIEKSLYLKGTAASGMTDGESNGD
jgi:hypothetical protein